MAAQLRQLGINWNLAPVVDVNVYPDSPGDRSPGPVVRGGSGFGFRARGGVRRSLHRRGGSSPLSSTSPGTAAPWAIRHLGVTDVTDSFERERELTPYRVLFDDGYEGAVMTAHIVNRRLDAQARPATLSPTIVTGYPARRTGL